MRLSTKTRTSKFYETKDGKKPFQSWLENLRDKVGRAKISARIERAKFGLFGDYRDLKDGVLELRDDFGPGYRIYFGIDDDCIIVLLAGGDKGSQDRDIMKAKDYWCDYLERKKK